jgi:tRNA threonylcarbamoyladenosine biosynthesis protein TsaE
MHEIVIESLQRIHIAAEAFLQKTKGQKCFAFKGEMGTGKTTFIQALCNVLNVSDTVTSPTFSIVNEYYSPTYGTIFHFDFYRIENETEVLDLGFEDYLNQNAIIFIEWPEMIPNYLPESALIVEITILENGERVLRF